MFRPNLVTQFSKLIARSVGSSIVETDINRIGLTSLLQRWEQTACAPSSWQTLLSRQFSSSPITSSTGDAGTPNDAPSNSSSAGDALKTYAVNSAEDLDVALDGWGKAMDQGDWELAWNIFETAFPVDTEEFPQIEELLAWDPDEEDRSVRREREQTLREEFARARVQRLDSFGRAHAVGKRKTSIARVWIKPGTGLMMINKRPYDQYFPALPRRNDMITPFIVTGTLGQFDVMAAVHGGGLTGQAQAMRHGISRALQSWDPDMRGDLKDSGLLTRDARIVERKKPGRKKARKAFQWVKR